MSYQSRCNCTNWTSRVTVHTQISAFQCNLGHIDGADSSALLRLIWNFAAWIEGMYQCSQQSHRSRSSCTVWASSVTIHTQISAFQWFLGPGIVIK